MNQKLDEPNLDRIDQGHELRLGYIQDSLRRLDNDVGQESYNRTGPILQQPRICKE